MLQVVQGKKSWESLGNSHVGPKLKELAGKDRFPEKI